MCFAGKFDPRSPLDALFVAKNKSLGRSRFMPAFPISKGIQTGKKKRVADVVFEVRELNEGKQSDRNTRNVVVEVAALPLYLHGCFHHLVYGEEPRN